MCNPRRVVVRVARQIVGQWQEAVEREREVTGQVEATSQIVAEIALAEELGDLALETLDQVLAGGFRDWQQTDDGYRLEVAGVEMLYTPGTRDLRIQATAQDVVSAVGRARMELEYGDGQPREITAEAVGRYYSDGWGGRTERRAREEAQQEAERKAEQQERALREKAKLERIAAVEPELEEQAAAVARERLRETAEQRRSELRIDTDAALEASLEEVQQEVNFLIGETYRQTLLRVVELRGGRVIRDDQVGSMVNLMAEI